MEKKEEYKLIHSCKPDINGFAICACTFWQKVPLEDTEL